MTDGVLHHFHEEEDEDPVLLTKMLPHIRERMTRAMYGSDVVLATSIEPREGVPRDGGIYFLIWDDLIVYVGQASCILDRIRQHAVEKRFIDRVAFICGIPEWWRTEIEHAYIEAWSPPWNSETKRTGSLRELPELREMAGKLDRSAVAQWHTPVMDSCSPRLSWPKWRQHILGRIQHLHPEQNVMLSAWE